MTYILPSKLPQYLVRLQVTYDRKGQTDLRDMIAACRYYVDEAVAHDNWNGGMDGHDVVMFVPLGQLAKIDPEDQAGIESEVKDLLSKLASGI